MTGLKDFRARFRPSPEPARGEPDDSRVAGGLPAWTRELLGRHEGVVSIRWASMVAPGKVKRHKGHAIVMVDTEIPHKINVGMVHRTSTVYVYWGPTDKPDPSPADLASYKELDDHATSATSIVYSEWSRERRAKGYVAGHPFHTVTVR